MNDAGFVRAGLRHAGSKPLLWALCVAPLCALVWGAWQDELGANPAEALIRSTGDWALRLLCVTLTLTPWRVQMGWPELARFRRMLGLWAYAYAVLHFVCYAWFEMGWDMADIWADVAKRPFILVGALCLGLLTPLALTSWNGAVRALGGARWRRLHQTVYAVAPLVILHFYWMRAAKHRLADVWFYGAWLMAVLLWRAMRAWHHARIQPTKRS